MHVDLQWNRIVVRVVAVGLLGAGVASGVYLGQDRDERRPVDRAGELAVQSDIEDMQLLKRSQGEHVAARAYQREAETEAAAKAAAQAQQVAGRAQGLEKAVKRKKEAAKKAASGADVPYNGPIPGSCNEYSGNRAIGCALTLSAGWEIAQFPCLEKLFSKESGWNHRAENKSSGAYGIPQALPGSKMGSIASDWRTNPATQIKWGLQYVTKRYKSPCGAWSYWQSHHSY
jgi:hypothetical protein